MRLILTDRGEKDQNPHMDKLRESQRLRHEAEQDVADVSETLRSDFEKLVQSLVKAKYQQ